MKTRINQKPSDQSQPDYYCWLFSQSVYCFLRKLNLFFELLLLQKLLIFVEVRNHNT